MTICIRCKKKNKSVYRTGEMGSDPKWMCLPCIQITEPELAKNLQDDGDVSLANIINKHFNGKTKVYTRSGL